MIRTNICIKNLSNIQKFMQSAPTFIQCCFDFTNPSSYNHSSHLSCQRNPSNNKFTISPCPALLLQNRVKLFQLMAPFGQSYIIKTFGRITPIPNKKLTITPIPNNKLTRTMPMLLQNRIKLFQLMARAWKQASIWQSLNLLKRAIFSQACEEIQLIGGFYFSQHCSN